MLTLKQYLALLRDLAEDEVEKLNREKVPIIPPGISLPAPGAWIRQGARTRAMPGQLAAPCVSPVDFAWPLETTADFQLYGEVQFFSPSGTGLPSWSVRLFFPRPDDLSDETGSDDPLGQYDGHTFELVFVHDDNERRLRLSVAITNEGNLLSARLPIELEAAPDRYEVAVAHVANPAATPEAACSRSWLHAS